MGLDIDFWCKTTLKHLRDPFPAIYHHPGQYRPLYRNLNFWPKSIFWRILGFSTSQNMTCHLAGSGRKYDWWPEIVSLDSQTLLHYLYDILWSLEPISNTIEKSSFSQYFLFRILKGKYYKIMIFQLCSKLVLMIIKYHISYVEVFRKSKETISGHQSYFRALSAKWQAIFWEV